MSKGITLAERRIALRPKHGLPALIVRAGERTLKRFMGFFALSIRNANTREAYARAAWRFLGWCELRGLELGTIEPLHVASYVEELGSALSAPSVKQHLAALRMLFDYLVSGGLEELRDKANPAASVRGPKHVVQTGKTPVLYAEDARTLLGSLDTSHVVGLRDRALIGVMTYSFARVGAAIRMRVSDYESEGRRAWFVLHEKGGKFHRVPAHHKAAEYVDAYLAVAGIGGERKSALFRTTRGRSRRLTERPMSRQAVVYMVKRRAKDAGLSPKLCCHTFRATGITNFLQNGGTLETAARIAAHASTRTTQLYDRTKVELSLEEVERIRL